MRTIFSIVLRMMVCLVPAVATAEQVRPRSMLILDEADVRGGPFYYEVFSALRSTVNAGSQSSVTIFAESLDLRRFGSSAYEESLHAHLGTKYRDRPIGVIVAIGAMALEYALRSASPWPGVPVVFSMVDEVAFARLKPSLDVTGRIMKLSFRDMMTTARVVVPDLRRIAILGEPWERQTINRNFPNEIPIAAADVELIDLTGVPMRELRERVAKLPDHTAIIYTGIYSDGEGAFYPPADALGLIAKTANRPIVINSESLLGRGGIGGFLMSPALIGDEAARLALRVLDGEPPSSIPVTVGNVVRPIFDWRQMQRWGVSEFSLPLRSEIRFRDPTLWDQFRAQVIAICAAMLLQAALIGWLIYEHRRRHLAEVQSRQSMDELTFMNRRAAAGELSASIAHEVNQPLTGIATRASAALRWLRAETPNLEKVEASLEQIVAASHRAADIVTSIRAMFRKDTNERRPVDINKLILTVLSIVQIDLQKNDVELQTRLDEQLPIVLADKVQLQQVVLNLVTNAIEAMHSVQTRVLKVRTDQPKLGMVRVSIEDTGTGIVTSDLNQIFKPLFTTKASGTGMGLAICHSIIESHNGRIWVSPGTNRGSIFQIELPTSASRHVRSSESGMVPAA